MLVTQGRDGKERVYRDVTSRPTRRASVRHSKTNGNRSSLETPSSSAPSPVYVEVRPEAPSPPQRASDHPATRRVTISDEPITTIRLDGTAVYEHPPPLDLPRATENERQGAWPPSRTSSISSLTAEVDEPIPIRRRRRPSIKIDTSGRPSTASSSSKFSSGFGQLPPLEHTRHDSAWAEPKYRPRDSARDSAARQLEEDDRQARIERNRLAESERRQEARRNMEFNASSATRYSGDSSHERHIQDAAAALEGKTREEIRKLSLDAEFEQQARERTAAEMRKKESDQSTRYADEQLRRHADASSRYYETRANPPPLRRVTGEIYQTYTASPLSARTPTLPVAVHHHHPPAARWSSTLRERGEDVIAREQARGGRDDDSGAWRASRRLTDVHGDMSLDGDQDVAVNDDHYGVPEYSISTSIRRRESRRARRDAEKDAKKREFTRRER